MSNDKCFIHSDLLYQACDLMDLFVEQEAVTVAFDSEQKEIILWDLETGEELAREVWRE